MSRRFPGGRCQRRFDQGSSRKELQRGIGCECATKQDEYSLTRYSQTVYNPNQVTAQVGDMIQFEFMGKNHTVTQSSFANVSNRSTPLHTRGLPFCAIDRTALNGILTPSLPDSPAPAN
jgi:hypothetical protein